MPVSVETDVGRRSQVKLKKAVLLYEEDGYERGDAFATVHEVTGVESGQPTLGAGRLLSVEGLRRVHKSLYRLRALSVLPPHVLALSPEHLVWFEPARTRALFFETQDAYLQTLSGQVFPQPALLFIAGERSLKVFALGSSERPTAATKVYTAPYYNTTAGVCLGSAPLPTTLSADDTEAYSDAFFPLGLYPRHRRAAAKGLGRLVR